MLKVLDLCAGTGSATKTFQDRGHEVETLDIIGEHTYACDVRTFVPGKKYDFIWASPPCTGFSIAKGVACRDRSPDLSIVLACSRIAKTATYWILENPRGCLRYFIGKPTVTIKYSDYGYWCQKPTDLWLSDGFPFFYSVSKRKKTISFDRNGKKNRATVPYGLSLAICKALELELEKEYTCSMIEV